MSLKVKHLNSDASFLLTLEPISHLPPTPGPFDRKFTILLDPWISGPSKIWHSKFSISTQTVPACIESLAELPEPDLVVISQDKSDHCHRETLTQLPASGGKTIILAEPSAAKTIRSWKYFDPDKIVTLPKWQDSYRGRKSPAVYRIPIHSPLPFGVMGEVTIAYLQQKSDITRLHSAIGITYRPPTNIERFLPMTPITPMTPPGSPQSNVCSIVSNPLRERALSVLFSPHGCSYKTLSPYVSSHLVAEAALPLTALLHSFDTVTNSWFLGGKICRGFPGGLEIAQNLCARVWISAHDGDKILKGYATTKLVVKKYDKEDVESIINPMSDEFPNRKDTEVVVLQPGDEKCLTQAMMSLTTTHTNEIET